MADLFADGSSATRRVVERYPYVDENGEPLFEVERYEPKGFRQRRPVGDQWAYRLNGVRRVIYRLREVLSAVADGRCI